VDENKANKICGHHKDGQYIYSSGLKKMYETNILLIQKYILH